MKKIMIVVVLSMWSAGLWCMDKEENTLKYPSLTSLFNQDGQQLPRKEEQQLPRKEEQQLPRKEEQQLSRKEEQQLPGIQPLLDVSLKNNVGTPSVKLIEDLRKIQVVNKDSKEVYAILKEHYKKCTEYQKNKKVSIKCLRCGEIKGNRDAMRKHLKNEHNISYSNASLEILESLRCGDEDNCNYSGTDLSQLMGHQKNKKHYVCYYCKQHIL